MRASFITHSIFIALLSLPLSAYAANQDVSADTSLLHGNFAALGKPYLRLGAGVVSDQAGSTSTLYLTPFIYNVYKPGGGSASAFSFTLGAGFQLPLAEKVVLDYGAGFSQTGNASLGGEVFLWGNTPASLSYSYSLRSQTLMFETRWEYLLNAAWQAGVNIDAGYGWVSLSNYSEQSLQGGASDPNPPFGDNRSSGFAYDLGLNVGRQFKKDYRVGFNVDYIALPNAKFARASGQQINQGLSVPQIKSLRFTLGLIRYFN